MIDTLQMANDDPGKLNEWETKFVDDFQEKFDKYGEETNMSPKQQAAMQKIFDKLNK